MNIYLILLLIWPFTTWIAYLAVMSLKANEKELTPIAKFFAYTFVILIGYPKDIIMNLVPGTLLFLELPFYGKPVVVFGRSITIPVPELLFTARCNRHITQGEGWRHKQAQWWCHNFLDPFDMNDRHCT